MSLSLINNSTITTHTNDSEPFLVFSEEFIRTFDILTNAIITPFVCVVGIVLNCVGVNILRVDRITISQSFYDYMLSLLCVQSTTLLIGLLRSVPAMIETYDYGLGNYIHHQMLLWGVYIDMVLSHIATFVLIAMSIERLCSLFKPFTFKEYVLTKRPKTVVVIASCISAVYLIPFVVCFRFEPIINTDNVTEYAFKASPQCNGRLKYVLHVETFLLHFISPVLVLVLNISIAIVYKRIIKPKNPCIHKRESGGQQMARLTSILLTIMTLYMMVSMPDLVAHTLGLVHHEYSYGGKYRHVVFFLINLSNVFMNINAGCAGIVYICASKRTWVLFKARCCHCLRTTEHKDTRTTCSTISNFTSGTVELC